MCFGVGLRWTAERRRGHGGGLLHVLRFEGMRLIAGFVCCCGEGDLAVERLSWVSSLLGMKGSLEAFKGELSLRHRLRTDLNLMQFFTAFGTSGSWETIHENGRNEINNVT